MTGYWGLRAELENEGEVYYLCWSTSTPGGVRWHTDRNRAVRYMKEKQAREAMWNYGRPGMHVEVIEL